jgi:formylglycine-generating enzyme required for sulfatase activity
MRVGWIAASVCLALVMAGLAVAQQPCPAGKALVIGNSAYRNLARIPGATADAHAIAAALREIHLQVFEETDTDIAKLRKTLQNFRTSLAPGDLAWLYYAGYGVQAQDDNYLLPVDFGKGDDLDVQAFSVSRIRDMFGAGNAGIKLLVLDVWRAAELAVRFPATELLPLTPGPRALVAYPVPSNSTGGRTGSLFSKHLGTALHTPGLTPVDVINRVILGVSNETKGQQVPMLNSLIGTQCYLTGPPPESAEEKLRKQMEEQARREAEDKIRLEREKQQLEEQLSQVKPGAIRPNSADKQEYVWIPPGSFEMGCVPEDRLCQEDEKPRHRVTITKGFWMGRTEVEVSTYSAYVRTSREKPRPAMPKATQYNRGWSQTNMPIVNVSWEEADRFCKWAGGRLPAEAEWEYAARGGAAGQIYPWGNQLSRTNANYAGAKGSAWDSMAPVKKFDPNSWGLYDIAGNVWEWTADWYDPEYYRKSPAQDPRGPAAGQEHVKRGGGFNSAEKELRVSIRHKWPKGDNNTGFRCVVDDLK